MAEHRAVTTQQAYPWRATARTVVQTILGIVIAAGVVIPLAVSIVHEELASFLPEQVTTTLTTLAVVSAAISAAVARIMAIPAVDAALRSVGLSSSPRV